MQIDDGKKPVQFRSIFVSLVQFVSVACLILCIVFATIFVRSMLSNYRERFIEINQNYLDTLVDNTDYLLESLHQSQTQLSYASNIWKLLFSKTTSDNYISDIKMDLIHLADLTYLIDEAFLYVPGSGTLISSDKNYSAASEIDSFKYSDMITDYENGAIASFSIFYDGKQSSLFYYDGNIVLVRDFPLSGEKRLASLFYTIEPTELHNVLITHLPESAELTVTTNDGTEIVLLSDNYPELTPEQSEKLPSAENSGAEIGSYVFFRTDSSVTGWHYLYAVDKQIFQMSLREILIILAPVLLVMILLSALLSYIIARIIYRPIRRLTMSLDQTEDIQPRNDSPRNEIEYFLSKYQETAYKKAELNDVLTSISHDTTSRIFHNLIANTMEDQEKIPELLSIIHSQFREDDLYRVCLIEFNDGVDNRENEKIRLLSDLTHLSQKLGQQYHFHSHTLMMQGLTFAIIIAFQKNTLIASVHRAKYDLENSVLAYAKDRGITVIEASGHMYHSIYDLCYSYQDALKTLIKEKSEPTTGLPTDSQIAKQTNETTLEADFDTHAGHILNTLVENDLKRALSLTHRILREIEASSTETSSQANQYIEFMGCLLDRLLSLEYVNHLPVTSEGFADIMRFKDPGIIDHSLYDLAVKECDTLLEETARILKKQKNHYIVEAQEYIAEHYQDYDLNLNRVADAVGINPSYLSRLFINTLGIHFTDYLNGYRINQSIEFLEHTTESVKDISDKTGFNSVQNYIRVFKKTTGYTPKQYRNNYSAKGQAGNHNM